MLIMLSACRLTLGDHAFPVAAARASNALPLSAGATAIRRDVMVITTLMLTPDTDNIFVKCPN